MAELVKHNLCLSVLSGFKPPLLRAFFIAHAHAAPLPSPLAAERWHGYYECDKNTPPPRRVCNENLCVNTGPVQIRHHSAAPWLTSPARWAEGTFQSSSVWLILRCTNDEHAHTHTHSCTYGHKTVDRSVNMSQREPAFCDSSSLSVNWGRSESPHTWWWCWTLLWFLLHFSLQRVGFPPGSFPTAAEMMPLMGLKW